VLVGGVVDHEVHDEPHAASVDGCEQGVELLERAELRVDVLVVADVVPVVGVRRAEDRGQPDHVDAEPFEVVESPANAAQVADTVPVGVLETARVHLVDDGVLPPPGLVGGCREERGDRGLGDARVRERH
jgi:hypothetical protein